MQTLILSSGEDDVLLLVGINLEIKKKEEGSGNYILEYDQWRVNI